MQRIRKTYKFIFILGILVVLIPYAGFPRTWDTLLLSLAGALIAALALVMRSAFIALFSGVPVHYASGEMKVDVAEQEPPLPEEPKRRRSRPRKVRPPEEALPTPETAIEEHDYHEDVPPGPDEKEDRLS